MTTEQKKSKLRQQQFDSVVAVAERYLSQGWSVARPHEGINDLIAHKTFVTDTGSNHTLNTSKLHFILVATADTIRNSRFNGLAKNTFIQNALSNGAEPIFALVEAQQKKNGERDIKIRLENVNFNTRVRLTKRAANVNNTSTGAIDIAGTQAANSLPPTSDIMPKQ